MSSKLCTQITRWISFAAELQSTYIGVSTLTGISSFVAVLSNFIIILVIMRNSSFHTPSYALLCNLAISDLGVGLISQPLFIALRIAETKADTDLSCKLGMAYVSTTGCFGTLTLLTITAISFDRLLAVHLITTYRSVVTLGKIKVVISVLWLLAILNGMTYVLDISIFVVLILIFMTLCLFLATGNYLAIARKLYRHNANLQANNKEKEGNKPGRKSFNIGQYKETVKTMLYVYVTLLLCYLPYLFFTVALKSIGRTSSVQVAYLVTSTVLLGNSAINPCLYYWRIKELRQAVRNLSGLNPVNIREITSASTYSISRVQNVILKS